MSQTSKCLVRYEEHPDNPRDVEVRREVVEMYLGFRWDLTPSFVDRLERQVGVDRPNPAAMALHLIVNCSLSLLDGSGRAIQLIDVAGALRQAPPGTVVADVLTSGSEAACTIRLSRTLSDGSRAGKPLAIEAARSLQPFVPEPTIAWAESASLYDVSRAGRNSHRLMQRHPTWALNRREWLTMFRHTFAPDRSLLANQGHATDAPADVLRSYLSHYGHLMRRLRLLK